MEKSIKGTYAVLMTPFIGNRVNYGAFEEQVLRLSGTGISGYVVNGSTAEFVHLTMEEKNKLVEIVAMKKDADKKVIVSGCKANLSDTLDICYHAKTVNADAMLVCPPYYFKYTREEIKEFCVKLADNSPVPIILYNIPFFTQELELPVIYDLMDHPNIIGIKDSSGNMKRIMHLVDKAKDKSFSVMTGTDDMLLPAFVGGCTGSMTALAAIYPEKISKIYHDVSVGDYESARVIQHSIMEDLRKADSQTFPVGYKKLMEDVSGIKFGNKEI